MLGRLRRLAAFLLWCLLLLPARARPPVNLPVYIEDTHSGSFYWMVEHLPRGQSFHLLLFDAHSDSDQVFDSDRVRAQVRAASARVGALGPLLEGWRRDGKIQCFDWIEPLIPQPFSQVYWVPGPLLGSEQLRQRRQEVALHINAHQQAWPRQGGDFSQRYRILDLASLRRKMPAAPLVVSVDLDYFADLPEEEARIRLGEVLDAVVDLKNLQALTFAISRPYLKSDAQAHALLFHTLRHLSRLVNVDVHFEPFASTGPDRSALAAELQGSAPRYSVETAPPRLRSLIVQNAERIRVERDSSRWQRLLADWRTSVPRISVHGGGVVLENAPRGSRVSWKLLVARDAAYNLVGGQGFADQAPSRVRWRELTLDGAAAAELEERQLMPFLQGGWGTLRLFCEVGEAGTLSNIECFTRSRGRDYPGFLTEIFSLPYIYGSALLRFEGKQSADALCGADCAHFIIYGKRRQGRDIPYVNPRGLLPYLEDVDEFAGFRQGVAWGRDGPVRLTPALVGQGLVLHFGAHVAAIFEDGEGVLTERTPVVHQLESYPQVTTFGALAARYPRIRLMRFRGERHAARDWGICHDS